MPASASYKSMYGTARWKGVRRLVLARAGGRCEMTPGCPNVATTVDHVIPAGELARTGQLDRFYDPALLRAACAGCNASAGASFGNRQRRRVRVSWAERENAYWAQVERERLAAAPRPRIY